MQQSSTAANSNKRPCKGILKTSSSFDKHSGSHRKSAKFDELNVLQTYHPPNKDYGHMKIEEPKTPYNYADPLESDTSVDKLDAALLAEKLTVAAQSPAMDINDESSDEEENFDTDEEKARRKEFEKRRKAHYNEFEAVRLARKLIEEEDDDDDEDSVENPAAVEESTSAATSELPDIVSESTASSTATESKDVQINSDKKMELDQQNEKIE